MRSLVVALAGIVLGLLLVVVQVSFGRTAPAHRTPERAVPLLAAHDGDEVTAPVVPPPPDSFLGDDDPAVGQLDIQGDEVKPAVATYGVDRAGNLYEIHSPMTEVPRLGSPVS